MTWDLLVRLGPSQADKNSSAGATRPGNGVTSYPIRYRIIIIHVQQNDTSFVQATLQGEYDKRPRDSSSKDNFTYT